MVYLDIIQVVVVVQCVIVPQLGLVMMLVLMIVFQLIMEHMIELGPMMFDQIHDVIMKIDVIMLMVRNMMHRVILVAMVVDK
jgi:hypothetical protein